MIRLNKGDLPRVLADNARAWTAELLALLRAGNPVPRYLWERYKHQEIKSAVRRDSHDKCIYCESKLLHVTHGDIEHLKPKVKYPERTYDWSNLGFVCTRCNVSKGDQYDEDTPPINPYEENPEAFLMPVGQLIWPLPANDRGQLTEAILKLNRAELITKRQERLETIRRLVDTIARTGNAAVRQALMDQLNDELTNDREYLFVCRAAANALTAHLEPPTA